MSDPTKIALIGHGAVARYLVSALAATSCRATQVICRPGRSDAARAALGDGIDVIHCSDALAAGLAMVVDCAGHKGLRAHGGAVLRAGLPLVTMSLGALADDALHADLRAAAEAGGARLHLVSGAIGALDALCAVRVGGLSEVSYTGRKPPEGWRGSPAEDALDLSALIEARLHFEGSARAAALRYPKNANVAAAVALAGVGFDATRVRLIADPQATGNTHEISAKGAFGAFSFSISGNSLPDTPRTSALAAMSMLRKVLNFDAPIGF